MNTYRKLSIYLFILGLFVIPVFINAQPVNQQQNSSGVVTIPNPTNAGSDLMSVLRTLLNKVVMPIAAVAVVVWIVWAGFTYVTANGKPDKIKEAHARLLWALIGAGILLGAAGISAVVESTVRGLLVQ